MQPIPTNPGPVFFSIPDETAKYTQYHQTFTASLMSLQTNLMECFHQIFSGPSDDIEAAISRKNEIVKKQVELAPHIRVINSALEVLKNPGCTKEMLDGAISQEHQKNLMPALKLHYFEMVANLVKEVQAEYRGIRDDLESRIGMCLTKMLYASEKPDLLALFRIRKEANEQLILIKNRISITNLIVKTLEQPDCDEAKIDALFRRFAEKASEKTDFETQLQEKKDRLLGELQDVCSHDPESEKFKKSIIDKYRTEMTRMYEDSVCVIQESSEESVVEKHVYRTTKILAFLYEMTKMEQSIATLPKRP